MISIHELLQEIVNGKMDPFRDQITEAFRLRQKNQGLVILEECKPGVKVKLVNCQKYLAGATGVVTATHKQLVLVDLDAPRGKFHKNVKCPPGLLQIIK